MAKNTKNTKNSDNDNTQNAETSNSAGRKKAADRTPEEQASVEAKREENKVRQQERMTSAITKAVSLNAAITAAAMLPLVERIEALRDSLVSVERVRAEIADSVRSQAFRGSVDVIINQALELANVSWSSAMDSVRELTAE